MRTCPKCEIAVDDSSICRRCGSILEDVAESAGDPGSSGTDAPEPEGDQVADSEAPEPGSWLCLGCAETVPANFEKCWSCGGVRPPVDPRLARREAARTTGPPPPPKRPTPVCPRCGSGDVLPGLAIGGAGRYGTDELTASVDGEPDALIFRDTKEAKLRVDLCGQCGHVEWWATNARQLFDHWRRSQR